MIKNAFTEVFKNKSYLLLSGAVALVVFAFAVWFPNVRLLFSLITDPAVPVLVKIWFPIRLLESITTNFTALSASYTIVIAVLTGINIAFVIYILKRQKQQLSAAGLTTGTFGILSGATGLGCAACGSLVVSSLLATAGGASLLTLLPLRGGEFGILGVILLGASTYFLAKHITKSPVCEITT
jgi:hypothetical protein